MTTCQKWWTDPALDGRFLSSRRSKKESSAEPNGKSDEGRIRQRYSPGHRRLAFHAIHQDSPIPQFDIIQPSWQFQHEYIHGIKFIL